MAKSEVKKFKYDDFTDKKILGEGSFNQVYLTNHHQLGKCVVKVVCRTFHVKQKQKPKLEQEAKDMFAIKHKHIIAGLGIVMEPDHLCLVYEFADYGCLTDALRRIRIAMPLKLRIAYQVSLAVEYLHSISTLNIVHRSLKSSNVLLTKDFTVKVSDFLFPKHSTWITEATKEKDHTERKRKAAGKETVRTGAMLAHIPPETMKNINTKPHPSYDVYSYGVILWELLTNKVPFAGESTQNVFTLMCNGCTLPLDAIPSDHPSVMFEVMRLSFAQQPEQRPTFADISRRLGPVHEATANEALSAVTDCQQAYEEYRVKKRRQIAEKSQQVPRGARGSASSEAGDRSRTFDDKTVPPAKPGSSQGGQMVERSAHVVPFAPPALFNPTPPQEEMMTETQATQSTDAELDETAMDVSQPCSSKDTTAPSPSEVVQEPARSYSETGKNPDKATPFTEEEHRPRPTNLVELGDATNISIYGNNVNLQFSQFMQRIPLISEPVVVHNAPPSSDQTAPTTPVTPSSHIPALYSNREMDTTDYNTLSRRVGLNWKFVARNMGLHRGEIDVIDHDYDRDGLKEKIYQLFRRWNESKGGGMTVANLAALLIESDLRHLARELRP